MLISVAYRRLLPDQRVDLAKRRLELHSIVGHPSLERLLMARMATAGMPRVMG